MATEFWGGVAAAMTGAEDKAARLAALVGVPLERPINSMGGLFEAELTVSERERLVLLTNSIGGKAGGIRLEDAVRETVLILALDRSLVIVLLIRGVVATFSRLAGGSAATTGAGSGGFGVDLAIGAAFGAGFFTTNGVRDPEALLASGRAGVLSFFSTFLTMADAGLIALSPLGFLAARLGFERFVTMAVFTLREAEATLADEERSEGAADLPRCDPGALLGCGAVTTAVVSDSELTTGSDWEADSATG